MNMIAQAASGNEVLRYAVYARFSSVLQNPRSIDDQIELCRTRIAALGGIITAIYTDSVTTGVTLHRRPGVNALLDDAKTGLFDAVFAEALDRISRNQADMADIYRRLEFQEISLITAEEGNICPMQIGFKGTMNQTFVDNLGNKTRRGHLGVVREGRIPGGLSYGYRVANIIGSNGKPIRGLQAIQPAQAKIVRRIFALYIDGMSPRQIAIRLNAENIPAPRGGAWTAKTIRGSYEARTGILHNDLYNAKVYYNRSRSRRNPETGTRRVRLNPRDVWEIAEAPPGMRIIDELVWEQAQLRSRSSMRGRAAPRGRFKARRPLTPLIRCGHCGGPMVIEERRRYSCVNRRRRGGCTMNRGIAAISPETQAAALLCGWAGEQTDWTASLSGAIANLKAARARIKTDLEDKREQIDNIVRAIAAGASAMSLHTHLLDLERDSARLEIDFRRLAAPPTEAPTDLAKRLARQLGNLEKAIAPGSPSDRRQEALFRLSRLIERIDVHAGVQRGQTSVAVVPAREHLVTLALEAPHKRQRRKTG